MISCKFAVVPAILTAALSAQTTPMPKTPTATTSTTYPQPNAQQDAATAPKTPTRAEVLRGAYGPYRANNDLLYYHLDVRVDPVTKTIAGMNTVRFKAIFKFEHFCVGRGFVVKF